MDYKLQYYEFKSILYHILALKCQRTGKKSAKNIKNCLFCMKIEYRPIVNHCRLMRLPNLAVIGNFLEITLFKMLL